MGKTQPIYQDFFFPLSIVMILIVFINSLETTLLTPIMILQQVMLKLLKYPYWYLI